MKTELTTEDRQRIEQATIAYTGGYNQERHDSYIGFVKGAEYATIYEREQQQKLEDIIHTFYHNTSIFKMRELFPLEKEDELESVILSIHNKRNKCEQSPTI